MTDIIGEIEQGVKAIVCDAEELFPPKPGGMVDRHRKRKAAEAEAEAAGTASDVAELGRNRVRAVRVALPAAEVATATTVTVNATSDPVQKILGRSANRKRAVVTAVDAPVVLCYSLAAAADVQNAASAPGLRASGTILPVGVPYVIEHQGEVYAVAIAAAFQSPSGVAASQSSLNQVAYPIAGGQLITTVTPPAAGVYQVQSGIRIGGATVASGNNFQIMVGGVPVATLVQGTGVGQNTEVPVNVTVTAGQAITINAINADATASANVVGNLVVTPLGLAVTTARVSVSTETYDPQGGA